MSKLLLTYYGDDFTGSTDALEQLTLAGIRTALFIQPPTPGQLKAFPGLHALGIAGKTRSLPPEAMVAELKPAFTALRQLNPRHIHYKVCSTFDSSPTIGSIGRVIDLGAEMFPAPFIPLLVAAPALGRYTLFGQHFARYGIGSSGRIHRLDRHPSISKHPVTPMTEADLRIHLSYQTLKRLGLFDILHLGLPLAQVREQFRELLHSKPEVVLFDTLDDEHLARVGALLEDYAGSKHSLFSVGSSGIEAALAIQWGKKKLDEPALRRQKAKPVEKVLIGSGSCSPITSAQIAHALKAGFAELPLDGTAFANATTARKEIDRAISSTTTLLKQHPGVIVHTTRCGADKRVTSLLKHRAAEALGTAVGEVLRGVTERTPVERLCIAGGDTSSYAAGALDIQALEMVAPLTPGAPLCRVHAPGSAIHQHEIVFKGGQVGAENYFETLRKGKA